METAENEHRKFELNALRNRQCVIYPRLNIYPSIHPSIIIFNEKLTKRNNVQYEVKNKF